MNHKNIALAIILLSNKGIYKTQNSTYQPHYLLKKLRPRGLKYPLQRDICGSKHYAQNQPCCFQQSLK